MEKIIESIYIINKKEYSRYVGFGLIFGVARGFSLGLINSTLNYVPISAGAGAGIVLGSIIRNFKIKSKK